MKLQPFLRWVGGKGKNFNRFKRFFPSRLKSYLYIEPFVGSGGFLFNILPNKAIISDKNKHLMNCYRIIKENPNELIQNLESHEYLDIKLEEKHYKNIVKEFNKINPIIYDINDNDYDHYIFDRIDSAGYFLYLNARCFNGLYRENKLGKFNVGYNKYKDKLMKKIYNKKIILEVSRYLNDNNIFIINIAYHNFLMYLEEPIHALGLHDYKPSRIEGFEFEKALKKAYHFTKKRFYLLDPPYYGNFTSYNANKWNRDSYKDFSHFINKINDDGDIFMLCNSDNEFIRNLFKDYYIYIHSIPRSVSCKADQRKEVNEIVITNYYLPTLYDFIKT